MSSKLTQAYQRTSLGLELMELMQINSFQDARLDYTHILFNDMKLSIGKIGEKDSIPFYPQRYHGNKGTTNNSNNSSKLANNDERGMKKMKKYKSSNRKLENISTDAETSTQVFKNLLNKSYLREEKTFNARKVSTRKLKRNSTDTKKRKYKSKKRKRKFFNKWRRFKYHKRLNWDAKVLRKIDRYLEDDTKIKLFNITDDPVERKDIALENYQIVHSMLTYLAKELDNYVRMKKKKKVQRGHPSKFGGIWSPGWCKAS
ncbi:hypothetical protein SK128_016111 [Halocaridina rubra]|uniref:Uncharacterized protein n=1 Tax=Halocaridina rubra TaxID=373956 RepID=A0AAN9A1R1_HALRR